MKYNNKSELIEAIKSNTNLFIKEYYDNVSILYRLDEFSFIFGIGRERIYKNIRLIKLLSDN